MNLFERVLRSTWVEVPAWVSKPLKDSSVDVVSHDFDIVVDVDDNDDNDEVDFGVIKLGLFVFSQLRPDLSHQSVER